MKRSLIILLTCWIGIAVQAQNVTVSVPRVVTQGENFRLSISIDAEPTSFSQPTLSGVSILAGPSSSTSQNVQIINGNMTQSKSITYTYVLQADKEGKYDLGTASFEVNGKTYTSQKIQIEVVKGDPNAAQQQSNSRGQSTTTSISNDDLFVRIQLSKTSAYRGEYLLATVKLYSKTLNIAGFEDIKFPTFNGFWNQEVESPQQINFQRENINGAVYNAAVLRRYLLFPQQTGEISIEPFEITCALQFRNTTPSRSIFDDFFDTPQTVRKKLVSPIAKVNVKALPAGAPASFTGAVGNNFRMEAAFQRDTLTANDAVSLVVKISGEGNIKLVEAPKVEFPPHFEVYDTKITDNTKASTSGISGNKDFEYPLIPRNAGRFAINPVEFTYFDISKNQYITLTSKDLLLRVGKDPNAGSAVTMSGVNQQNIKALGEDIRYIKTANPKLHEKGATFFNSTLFYLLALLQITVFAVVYFWMKKHRKESQNLLLVRTKKANKVARKRLAAAGKLQQTGDSKGFYEELTRALWGYLSDKLSISVADLSRDNAREALLRKNISEEDIAVFLQVIDECEFARYAPGQAQGQMQKTYDEAIGVISRFEQTIK